MRIDPTTIPVLPVTPKAAKDAKDEAPRSPERRGTIVELSTAGAAAMARTTPPEISARVHRLQAEVAAGTYAVDLEKLAERIVDDDASRGGFSS